MKRIMLILTISGMITLGLLIIYGQTKVETRDGSMDKPYIASTPQNKTALQNYVMQQWEKFKSLYGNQWEIQWNRETGFPEYLSGPGTGSVLGKPDQTALSFISENKELLQIDPTNLKTLEVIKHPSGKVTIVHFQQVQNGKPVEGGRVIIDVNNERGVTHLQSTYRHEIDLAQTNLAANIDRDTALGIALEDEGLSISQAKTLLTNEGIKFTDITDQITLVFHQKNKKSYSTWKIPLFRWIYYIDATTGEIIDKQPNIRL